ncbi:MAG: hypothetical protein V4724_37570 [Pseudomonadota bacterium]
MPLQALTLRLCVEETAHPPYITPDGYGDVGLLIRKAAKEAGIGLEFRAVPLLRCREEVRFNRADGYPLTPYTPSLTSFVAFPMNGNEADLSYAVATWRILVYRRAGTQVKWDGSRFTSLTTSVLVPTGSTVLVDRLTALGVAVEQSGKTLEMNFLKLLAGRADVVIDTESKGSALMTQTRFQQGVEVLPQPFAHVPVYLGLSRQFFEHNTRASERLWSAIARIRQTPAYQNEIRRHAPPTGRDALD